MHPTEATQELIQELQQAITGEVKFDRLTRQLYSTDASSYRIVPAGVIVPRCADDVTAALEIAGKYGASLVPRGGGSSLSGQTIGPGLILDYSKYLNRILEFNIEDQWVRVEAGLVLDQLNEALRPYDLMVGPDPASGAVATLGGMAGNNSTGAHSIKYGLMIDHVQQVEVGLADGSRACFGATNTVEVEALAGRASLEGQLYRQIPRLIEQYRADIETGYPRTWRNVAGYNLNRLLADQQAGRPFNLAPLIIGSEGTLAHIINLTLKLVPRPRYTRLLVLHFTDLRTALETVPVILEHQPAAVELMDHVVIELARGHPVFGLRLKRFVEGRPQAILIVELAGDELAALAAQATTLAEQLNRSGYHTHMTHCTTPADIANVWTVRKEIGGLLFSRPGDAKPLSFVDDAAVPIEELADYALAVQRACHDLGVEVNLDGHASAGCLHMNPAINLKTVAGLEQMRAISEAVMQIAMAHHGTTTGEHGEGLARSYYNEQLYGPRLHQAFRQVKGLFDPHNRLNPGKIIDAPAPWEPQFLRMNPDYTTPLVPHETYLDFSQHGGLAGLVEMCYGQGMCRSLGAGTMCPSYRATRDELHSTRGRANALRAAMTGQLGPAGLTSHELYAALELCLECKACKQECSALIDMAKLKYEFLAHYQAEHGAPLRSRLFAHIANLNRLGRLAPGLTNWAYQNRLIRGLLDRTLGIDERRTLPPLAAHTFQQWFKQRPAPPPGRRGPVILWDDTYLSDNEPEIGQAVVKVLEAAGFEVKLIADRRCCGRPMISKGLLTEARQNAAHNVARLYPYAAQGIPLVGLEPSCLVTFRDEYPDLLRSDEAHRVAEQSFFIEEFLTGLAERGELDLAFAAPMKTRHILVHGHCYQKALTGTTPLLKMLQLLPNTTVEEIPSGCCGMAGAFGYEKEHYDLSLTVGEERLLPAVRAAGPDTLIAAAGVSCRQQIFDGAGRRAVHPIIILAEALSSA